MSFLGCSGFSLDVFVCLCCLGVVGVVLAFKGCK